MTPWNVAGLIMLAAFVFPFVVYLSVKLAAYGWKRGTQIWDDEQHHKHRRKNSGYEESK